MVISLDYDDTFTADPELWRPFVELAQRRGHQVVCITGRDRLPDWDREPRLPPGVAVILAGGELKRTAARRAGVRVDVWIDDVPGLIEGQRTPLWE